MRDLYSVSPEGKVRVLAGRYGSHVGGAVSFLDRVSHSSTR
jgi:hypothetical protein